MLIFSIVEWEILILEWSVDGSASAIQSLDQLVQMLGFAIAHLYEFPAHAVVLAGHLLLLA